MISCCCRRQAENNYGGGDDFAALLCKLIGEEWTEVSYKQFRGDFLL